MKRLINKWIALSTILLLLIVINSSCKKNLDESPSIPAQNPQKPLGNSIGEVYTEIIDSEGGTVKSPDGSLEIIIPANALSEPTEIGIEPIENTCAAGIGIAYRLTPHNKQFLKPVTIRFSYDGLEEEVFPEALTIASQDDKGVWKTGSNSVLNKTNKTVQVQSTHFSDWSFVETLKLLPAVASVKPGGQVKLTAVKYIERPDDILIPIDGSVITDETPLDSRLIKRWYVSGTTPGTISSNGNQATYTAADSEGEDVVTCELNIQGRQVLLIVHVTIMEDGIRISIDGGPWRKYPGMSIPPADGFSSIANIVTTQDEPQFKLIWQPSANPIYKWSDRVMFQMAMIKAKQNYVSIYKIGNEERHSGGSMIIREAEGDGKKYHVGKVHIQPSGVFSSLTGEQVRTAEVVAEIKVLKTW